MSLASKGVYEAVAKATSGIKSHSARQKFAAFMSDFFEEDNARFDRERFLIACNVLVTGRTKYVTVFTVQSRVTVTWEERVTFALKKEAEDEVALLRDDEPESAHRIIEHREPERVKLDE